MSKIASILLHVTGTNNQTRASKTVLARFNGKGEPVDSKGNLITGKALDISSIGSGATAPTFPQAEFQAAVASGDLEQVQAVQTAFNEAVAAWQKSQTGGTKEVQLARAAVTYLVQNEGFLREDGEGFVIKEDNLDVQVLETVNGEQHVTIGGTAVFGR